MQESDNTLRMLAIDVVGFVSVVPLARRAMAVFRPEKPVSIVRGSGNKLEGWWSFSRSTPFVGA